MAPAVPSPRPHRPVRSLALAFALIAAPALATAQEPPAAGIGTLAGVVIDSLGNGFEGLDVVLTRTDYSGSTNSQGAFLIPRIPAGRYLAAVSAPGADGRRVYPELFPVEVLPGDASGIVIIISPAVLEADAVELEADGVASLLGDLGIAVDTRVRSLVREGLQPGSPVRIVGTVRDAGSGRPVMDAEVRLEGTTHVRVADRAGRFNFENVQPGRHTLVVDMLGYATRLDTLDVFGGTDLDVQVALAQRAIELAPIIVEARSPWLERTGFYDRLHDPGNLGRIITRRQFENRAVSTLVDLFHDVSGARVDYRGIGSRVVMFRRVVGTTGGDGCHPTLYLDGMVVPGGWDHIPAHWIDAVEIYVGAARTPIQYSGNNPCGAVLVWTRRG
jgi:hypothetical protein